MGWCWLAVRDEGPGIAAENRDRVFDRFWRSTTDDSDSGRTGLGLAIVRQIAESHGGSVALHSSLERGSTFVVWLPTSAATGDPPREDPIPR
jgi:signal transduction histidine kinase